MAYTRASVLWKDWPDTSTPVTAAALNHVEDGLVTAAATADSASTAASAASTAASAAQTTANAAIPKSVVTAAGDVIYATGNAAVTRLALGGVGTVLKGGASAPSFATIVNADIDAAAAVAYSKLALTGSVVNADISATAAIAKSKLASLAIVNADVDAAAAIAYSKLNLALGIVNGDISASAAIGIAKLAGYPTDATKFLRGDATWAVPSGAVTSKYTTLIDLVNSTTETDLLQASGYTVAANALGASGFMRVTLLGNLYNFSGGAINLTIRSYFGGTKYTDNGTVSINSVNARSPFRIDFFLANQGGGTASQEILGTCFYSPTAVAATTGFAGTSTTTLQWSGLGTEDTTASKIFRVTAQFGTANAATELHIRQSTVEIL